MHSGTRTAPISEEEEGKELPPATAGLCAVFSERALGLPFVPGNSGVPQSGVPHTIVGRDALAELGVRDDQMSREHFEVRGGDGDLVLEDRESRNGTFVNGTRVTGSVVLGPDDVVRAGRTLFVVTDDVAAFTREPPRLEREEVLGPDFAAVLERARAMSRLDQLLILGESGTGKEHVARAFHGGDAPHRPFIALNCATLQGNIVERLLFGARKGAYTGAEADAEGYVRAADGGTLFLDEIAELEASVQAKLLRFIETREYFPLGDTRPRTAKVRICFATLKNLGDEVAARRFREDLYHRIATPVVRVPPLRERRVEIPFLIELEAQRHGGRVKPTLAFVEHALRCPWPGNVRQLRRTVEAALALAEVEGRTTVGANDLPDLPTPPPDEARPEPTDAEIAAALEKAEGNVSVAARSLGIHRSKLRRWMQKKP